MQIREKLLQEGIRVDTDYGQQKVICPKCSHTRRNKREPCLSINIEDNKYIFTEELISCWINPLTSKMIKDLDIQFKDVIVDDQFYINRYEENHI